MISDFVSWGLWSQFLPEMCAIYKVSRRKIERGVSWPVRQKASEACNLFLLQAGSIRPSPLGAIHRGDGHICFLCTLQQYVLVFRNYWMFSKYFLFQVGSTRPTGVLPNGRVSGKYATSGKIYPRKKCSSQTFSTCLWIKTRYFVPLLVYPVMLKLYTGVPLLLVIIATQ